MKWFVTRLAEPSTWAGFAAIFPALFSLATAPITPQAIGAVVAGAAAVLMKEKSAQ